MKTLTFLALLVLLLGSLPQGASAQLSGSVVASNGTALEGATVELWVAGRRVAATRTGADGSFALPEPMEAAEAELRAGALGFRTSRVPVGEEPAEYRIVLAEEPLLLEGLEVVMEGDICLRDDNEEARGLWERARAFYHQGMDTLGIATYLAEADTVVARENIGPLQLPPLALSQRSSGSILRFSWERRVDRSGYAYTVRRTDGAAAFDSWVYAPLEAGFAPHFVGDLFGELHKFVDPIRDDDGWTVAFCPRDDDRPEIRGTLVFAPDTSLVQAEWSFLTPEPLERAGGRAIFRPGAPDEGVAYPLPLEALIWRQVPDGRYAQRYQRYEGWKVVPGDSVPQLPLRGGAR